MILDRATRGMTDFLSRQGKWWLFFQNMSTKLYRHNKNTDTHDREIDHFTKKGLQHRPGQVSRARLHFLLLVDSEHACDRARAGVRNGRGRRSRAGARAGVRVAPKLRACRGGWRLGQHANTLKRTGKTTLEVADGTLLERHSSVALAPELIRIHVTKSEGDHDREGERARRRDWQEPVGHDDRTCTQNAAVRPGKRTSFG
eukprot:scaffold15362_cov72-Phaeocystis_antarctica.AAC.9